MLYKFVVAIHYGYLVLKMPGPAGSSPSWPIASMLSITWRRFPPFPRTLRMNYLLSWMSSSDAHHPHHSCHYRTGAPLHLVTHYMAPLWRLVTPPWAPHPPKPWSPSRSSRLGKVPPRPRASGPSGGKIETHAYHLPLG